MLNARNRLRGMCPKKPVRQFAPLPMICLTNNQPGVLFIGAKDNGEPSGLEITDQLLLALADMKTDGNILPLPVLSVEKRLLKNPLSLPI